MTIGFVLSCLLGVVATAHAAAGATDLPPAPPPESSETPDGGEASGAEESEQTGGPSLGAIVAACVGVLFGAVVARWQIKRFQQMKAG